MARDAVLRPAPPIEVIVQFLETLAQTVQPSDWIVPVLRGSVLLSQWFGDAARPAVDIDLEWFPQPGFERRRSPVIDVANHLCMCTVHNSWNSPIVFDENVPVPSDGVSLWDYGTPGVRTYTGWRWADRSLSGLLQVDLAQAGSYDLTGVVTETIVLPFEHGKPAPLLAYAPEMMLAAKLSWIVRHLERSVAPDGRALIAFIGEPKDLFDAHLLLTKGRLRSDVFASAWLAVAMEDKLDWDRLALLFDETLEVEQAGWSSDWTEFLQRHRALMREDPAEMLRTVIVILHPLLDEVRRHLPFLRAIQADPIDEASHLIYADWLEDRSDPRAEFLRLYCRFRFHDDRLVRKSLASAFSAQPGGWLYHVLGGPERSRDFRKRIEQKD